MQSDAAGDVDWSEELSSGVSTSFASTCLGAFDSKGMVGGLLIGVGLLIVAAFALLLNIKHLTMGERTVGVVVGYKDYHNGRSKISVGAPIVRYSAPGGVFETVGSLSVARSFYPVDKDVSVVYLRNNPRNAVIFDFVQVFLIPSALGALGLTCLAGTCAIMLWSVRGELQS